MNDQGSKFDQQKIDSVSASQAKIVRAFYDAAERIVLGSKHHEESRQSVRAALDDLSGLVEQASKLGSDEFSHALERAAREYFANVAAIQRNSLPRLSHRH